MRQKQIFKFMVNLFLIKVPRHEKYAQQIDGTYWKLQCVPLALVNRKDTILQHDNA